jgi:hypothetical protein
MTDMKDNIKMGRTEAVFESVGWIKLVQDTDH